MSSIVDFLKKVYPDFAKARKSRREIRQKYRENLKALERDDTVTLVMTSNDKTGYLTKRSEKAATEADHLSKKYGSESDPFRYKITQDKDEVRNAFENVIEEIDRRNKLSYGVEILFVAFVILAFTLSISIGAYGVENLIEWLIN